MLKFSHPRRIPPTEDGSVKALFQILAGQYLILEVICIRPKIKVFFVGKGVFWKFVMAFIFVFLKDEKHQQNYDHKTKDMSDQFWLNYKDYSVWLFGFIQVGICGTGFLFSSGVLPGAWWPGTLMYSSFDVVFWILFKVFIGVPSSFKLVFWGLRSFK